MPLPQTEIALTFYLLGGVTQAEALASQERYSHAWSTCGKWGCKGDAVAIMLIRGPSGQSGDIQGSPICSVHEGPFLAMVHESEGYLGATVVLREAVTLGPYSEPS
jgi:hypothetical protein